MFFEIFFKHFKKSREFGLIGLVEFNQMLMCAFDNLQALQWRYHRTCRDYYEFECAQAAMRIALSSLAV